MRIIKKNCTALVVDIQEKLLPAISESEALIKNCKILIEGLKILGIPTVYTQQYTKGLGETIADIATLTTPFSYFEKESFSCYESPEYVDYLQNANKNIVLICGIESHVCVLQTAVDLKDNGFIPVIIIDAVTSRKLLSKQIAMERFRHEGIMLSTTESILFELTRSSSVPEFKSISKLVK